MAGYKHFCIYCENLIPADANICPFCGMEDPFCLRCPKCRNIIDRKWQKCSCCGLDLHIKCPSCGSQTFILSYCEHCKASLTVKCPNKKCGYVQVKIGDKCLKCNKKI